MNALLITRFTIQEAVSRRLILAGALISVGYVALFSLGFWLLYDRLVRTTSAQGQLTAGLAVGVLTLFGVYVVNYLASFLALFLSVGAISGEIDAGTLHAVLARPIRRAEFILGRWLAYVGLVAVYVAAMTALVLLVARLVAEYEVPDPARAIGLMVLEGTLLVTLSLLGSTLLPTLANGVIVFTLLGLAWLAGLMQLLGAALGNTTLLDVGTAVSLVMPSDALWRGASYYLQPPMMLAASGVARGGIPFFGSAPPATALVVWAMGYTLGLAAAATGAFGRRDL